MKEFVIDKLEYSTYEIQNSLMYGNVPISLTIDIDYETINVYYKDNLVGKFKNEDVLKEIYRKGTSIDAEIYGYSSNGYQVSSFFGRTK